MRARWNRLIAGAVVVGATALASGCVVFQSGPDFSQLQTIGDLQFSLTACASNTTTCANKGNSDSTAQPGPAQALVALQVPESVTLPAGFTSTGPEALAFAESASYESELQRLAPAAAGRRWVGYITPTAFNYSDTSGRRPSRCNSPSSSLRAPTAAPSSGGFANTVLVGARGAAGVPGHAPRGLRPRPHEAFDEDPARRRTMSSSSARTPERGSPQPERPRRPRGERDGERRARLAREPAVHAALRGQRDRRRQLRPHGHEHPPGRDPRGHARRACARQQQRQPGAGGGGDPGRCPGRDLRRHAHRQARQRPDEQPHRQAHGHRAGGAAATTGGGTSAKLKLTTFLPKGLSAATARESGIAVLIGATKKATARVKLFQGTGRKNRRPKASKRVRLKVPGPVQVILKSEKLHEGPFRVVIRAGGRNFVRFGRLTQ